MRWKVRGLVPSVRPPAADRGVSSRSTVLGPLIDRFAPVSPSSSSPLSRWRFAPGSLRLHLRHRRCGRRNARVDRERHLREIRFAPPLRVPLAQNLAAIVAPAVALDHFVDREFLSVHPLEVHPAPRPPVVLAPYCYDPSERPQVRDHNLRDIPGLSGNLSYESSHVW